MASPAPFRAAPARAWRVDLDLAPTRWSCTVHGCPGALVADQHPTQAALGHLADHAAAESLEPHLRTCQCQAQSCRWHPRHRGCEGPVAPMVFRARGGKTWQLADACTACTQATPHAARLRQPPRSAPPVPAVERQPRPSTLTTRPTAHDLEPAITYLEAALEPGTTPAARLFALLCLLRADAEGVADLPVGLLRAWTLAGIAPACASELASQRWLHEEPASRRSAVQIRYTAGTGFLRASSRRHRARLLHCASHLLRDREQHAASHARRLAVLQHAASSR